MLVNTKLLELFIKLFSFPDGLNNYLFKLRSSSFFFLYRFQVLSPVTITANHTRINEILSIYLLKTYIQSCDYCKQRIPELFPY